MKEIKVSVICLAYNHEPYIRDALEGFVKQQTSFAYEVLVHDDASTDKTADIIREYEKKYPDLIKPVYQNINQYSQGIDIVGTFLRQRIQGKYIALCEGDDYWTSPYKLQKEYDALEQHPEVDICAHSSWILYPNGAKRESVVSVKDMILPIEEVILGGGSYVNTNTLMYRMELDDNIPEFRKKWNLDYTLQIHGSLRGGMLYLHEIMSVYRIFALGSWSEKMKNNTKEKIAVYSDQMKMCDCINACTQHWYQNEIEHIKNTYKLQIALAKKNYSLLKSEQLYRESKFRTRFLLYLACKNPKLYEKMIAVLQKRKSR